MAFSDPFALGGIAFFGVGGDSDAVPFFEPRAGELLGRLTRLACSVDKEAASRHSLEAVSMTPSRARQVVEKTGRRLTSLGKPRFLVTFLGLAHAFSLQSS